MNPLIEFLICWLIFIAIIEVVRKSYKMLNVKKCVYCKKPVGKDMKHAVCEACVEKRRIDAGLCPKCACLLTEVVGLRSVWKTCVECGVYADKHGHFGNIPEPYLGMLRNSVEPVANSTEYAMRDASKGLMTAEDIMHHTPPAGKIITDDDLANLKIQLSKIDTVDDFLNEA